MDCCAKSDQAATDIRDCPRCGQRGRTVGDQTLNALLVAPERRAPGKWRFCRSQDCPVVYFHSQKGTALGADALNVRVGQKEDVATRPICYCFGHSAADLRASPSIEEEIKDACKRSEHRCAETNPQGACCLGNVAAVLRT